MRNRWRMMIKWLTVACGVIAIGLLAGVIWARSFQSISSTHKWTAISGLGGHYKEDVDSYLGYYGYYSLEFFEDSDDPVEIQPGMHPLNNHGDTLESGHPIKLRSGNYQSRKKITVGDDQYITAIQVCVSNDKIKGARIWGARINNNGSLTHSPTASEFSRPNCLGHWQNKVSCGSEKLMTGIRVYYTSKDKGFGGIALRCSKFEAR